MKFVVKLMFFVLSEWLTDRFRNTASYIGPEWFFEEEMCKYESLPHWNLSIHPESPKA